MLCNASKATLFKNEFSTESNFCASFVWAHQQAGMLQKMVPSSIAKFLQVYERLQKLCISMSHRSVVRLQRDMGKDYDKMVHDWRKTFLPSLISNFKVNDAN